MLLSKVGFEVCSVSTGLECLAKLREWHPDALILSPKLIWGTGESVLAVLHEDADLFPIPTIVITDNDQYLTNVRPEWVQRYFWNPVVPQSVCVEVSRILDHNLSGKIDPLQSIRPTRVISGWGVSVRQ